MALGSCTWGLVVNAQVAQVAAVAECQLPGLLPAIGWVKAPPGLGALLPRIASGEAVAAPG